MWQQETLLFYELLILYFVSYIVCAFCYVYLFKKKKGSVVFTYQCYWDQRSQLFTHNYLSDTMVLLAGGTGTHSLLDIRQGNKSIFEQGCQYDASRVRFSNRVSMIFTLNKQVL